MHVGHGRHVAGRLARSIGVQAWSRRAMPIGTCRWFASEAQDMELPLPRARLDYRRIVEEEETMRRTVRERKSGGDVDAVLRLYAAQKEVRQRERDLQEEKNQVAAKLKDRSVGKEEKAQLVEEGRRIRTQLATASSESRQAAAQLQASALELPNFTHPAAPVGPESSARILRTVAGRTADSMDGSAMPAWWKDHLTYALEHELINFEEAASVTGHKFCFLQHEVALLDLALQQWALTKLRTFRPTVGRPFMPVATPDMVLPSVSTACGFQPRGEHTQVYSIENASLCMVGTSEIPLVARHSGQILPSADLPRRLAGFGHCFRAEAGSAGLASKGLYRLHQFSKVEMVVLARPDQSDSLLEELLALEEEMLQELELPYRVLDMPTEDLGAPAYRKYDIEGWMPSRGAYGELCSASNCTDYQSRRLDLRYRDEESGKPQFLHTLNATACATPRVILSILENHQEADGSVRLPPALHPFLHGITAINPAS